MSNSLIMKFIFISILQLIGLASNTNDQTFIPANPDTYKLVWSDEFNTEGPPDTGKWKFERGFVRNEEAQWYQHENTVCTGGNLIITGKKERKLNPNYVKGSKSWKTNREFIEYTSSSVVMQKEHAFQYGKLEVRAKIDAQPGLWPAIWTLGTSGEWPSNGEVDVMEYYDEKILANFAYGSATRFAAIWDGAAKSVSSFGGAGWANQFHVWTFEWDENNMRIFIDGELLNTIDLRTTYNKTDGKNPFRQPHYLLLNQAMGGTRGGSLVNTMLPSKYMIDYVRIYQKE